MPLHVMLVMSCPSTTNEPESCSSEGTSYTSSSMTTSDPSSMSAPTESKHETAPPPPLPPPPPPLPASMSNGQNMKKKRRVRSFFWKPIPEEKVRGKPNIWTMAVRQQQYQIDVRSVEELFGQQEDGVKGLQGSKTAPGTTAQVSRSRSFKESRKDKISILDSKRGMNVGIFLKQFKKSIHSIIGDIRRGEGKLYGAEQLKDLLKLLPDEQETKKLQAFKGNPDKLTLVDSFMYLLIQVPCFDIRIEAMVLQEEFFPCCAVMGREIDVMRTATKELMSCEELHAILHLVLQAGNIMNAGGYAGNAVGFKLSSLLSLADTKANKPGMNLLHFVAMEAKKKDEKLLKFPEKLHRVQSAARISMENIEMEFSSLYVRIKSLEEKVQRDEELQQQLEPFLQNSASTLQDLKRRRVDLRKEGNTLIDFFCEDKDTFQLDECFRIFQDFCNKFNKAVKDNMDREFKEAARQRRLRELEEKRCAWLDTDQSGGFGRSSSENDVEMLTKEGLLDFLQQRAQSPHSPLGRSASARRHRHTMTSIADRELRGYLFGGSRNPTDYPRFSSLPRSSRPLERKTMPWIFAQENNRELGPDRPVTSPHAETEPVSPLARFSSPTLKDKEDAHNNNKYLSLSESSVLPHSYGVFEKPPPPPNSTITGFMNINVEKHTLVPGPQAFDLPGPNNNSNHKHLVSHSNETDLEKVIQTTPMNLERLQGCKSLERRSDPKAVSAGTMDTLRSPENEEDHNTFSSTTCDTPLPLDTSASNKKAMFYMPDCTEADCSVTLDFSETESSSFSKEGLHYKTTDNNRDQDGQQDRSSLSTSPNDQSISTNELSLPKSDTAPVATSADRDDWNTERGNRAKVKKNAGKDTKRPDTAPENRGIKANKAIKCSPGQSIRMLTSSESQGMRRVVPINRPTRTSSSRQTERQSAHEGGETRRPLRNLSTPARGRSETTTKPLRHSSLPPDESKVQRGGSATGGFSRWARDSMPRKASINKPRAKPVRNIPKPEEKMCRSTMRALALAQAQTLCEASSENSSSQTLSAKNSSEVPSFARSTVASSTRIKKESGPPSVPSTPSRSASVRGRQASAKQNRVSSTVHTNEERLQGTSIRRVQSLRAASRGKSRSETPPPTAREDPRKASIVSEKSVQPRDSATPSKSTKPSWK
ncbi:FH2 domain-containing protein 1 [Gouania willdenowi]|uniref:FH2 domain-containing protein n=1 Tax=Gouania willdenowi TaxID=441366 RepID=A0A8C5G409_GOUWI|nr:FH2 domain-containing protein 1 [Gouania willdenowi]